MSSTPLQARLTISRTDFLAAGMTTALVFACKGQALLLGYAVDDYAELQHPFSGNIDGGWIAQGRWFSGIVLGLISHLGYGYPTSFSFGCVLSLLTTVFAGWVIAKILGATRAWQIFVVSSVVAIHPYLSEIFTFRVASGTQCLSWIPTFAGIALIASKRRFLLASFLFLFAISIYQQLLNYIVMAGIVLLIAECRDAEQRGETSLAWVTRSRSVLYFTSILICLVAYVVEFKLTTRHTQITDRAKLLGSSDIAQRLHELSAFYQVRFMRDEPLIPFSTKIIIDIAVALAVIALLSAPSRQFTSQLKNRALALVCLLVAVAWFPGVVIAFGAWWPVPRVVSHISLFVAMILAILVTDERTWFRRAGVVTGLITLYSFASVNARVFMDQVRINDLDKHVAESLLTRLENQDDFANVRRIAVGSGSAPLPEGVTTTDGDMNISAWYSSWGRPGLFTEISGRHFEATTDADNTYARDFCEHADRWPTPGSFVVHNAMAVVCF